MQDGSIDIATGMSANSRIWKNKKILWSELIKKLQQEHKTNETLKEFLSATKDDQSKIKDVGGYVGGYLRAGTRKPGNVLHRQLLTLDLDFAPADFWEIYTLLYGETAVLHGTHKHCEDSPRFRLVMPLSRECSPDEYVAVSRRIAGSLGIDNFDNTTFETNRLMFWPSSPKDVEYYFEYQEGPWLNVDKTLKSYVDWTDSSQWPMANKKLNEVKDTAKKQEDPETKRGVIGSFCRTYSITAAIETFLSDLYTHANIPNRYTYIKGSTSAGLMIYEDKFAYSHHGTDPVGGKLCNSFDLVRIHLYGHLDLSIEDKGAKSNSFKAMEALAIEDKEVKKTIAIETINNARYDFDKDLIDKDTNTDNLDWMQNLEVDQKSNYLSTASNLNLIFANDARIKNLFRQNDFDGKRYVFSSLPWRVIKTPESIKNVDYSGLRNYIECVYGISGTLKVDDSLALEFERNHYHPIQNYLTSLKWDNKSRIDKILVDYFGAEDNIYTREAIRKMFVGGVARIMDPGTKFDLVLTLVSHVQGTGKSSFLKALGQSWFSDSFLTVQGKEAFEQLQGAWIIELAELSGLKKTDIESTKHFISKQEDTFRPAYMRVPETFKRQCIFVATTNESNFLRDPSGNRRFMPVDVHNVKLANNTKLKELISNKELINQFWAEAMYLYANKEPLFLSEEAEGIANKEQRVHSETDERKGLIDEYLNTRLPHSWEKMSIFERQAFIEDSSSQGENERDFVCIAEIWCECLGKNKEDMDKYKTREINDILRGMEDWEPSKSTKRFKHYGTQRYYTKRLW